MKKVITVCPYCGSGCKINLLVENNKVVGAEGANGVTNEGALCLKGLYGWDFLNDTKLLTPRLKRPLIASLISGFICGAVAGIAGLASHSMAAPGLFTSVQFFDPANPMTIVWVFGVMALSVVLSFALTLILGFEDIPVEQAAADARARQARAQASHA